MSVTFTAEELKEFEGILDLCESPLQMARIHGRIDMPKFVKTHGKEKCDAMFTKLTERK